jgi:hypothetical protein
MQSAVGLSSAFICTVLKSLKSNRGDCERVRITENTFVLQTVVKVAALVR